MKRGEIWSLQDENYASKPRPVIIVQGKLSTEFDSIILCLFTSVEPQGKSTRVKILPSDENGLRKASFVMTEKLLTIKKSRLGSRIGRLTDTEMREISGQLARVLGIEKEDITGK